MIMGEKIKILQVINNLNTGGAEKLLLDTIPLYNIRGFEMDILVLNGIDSPFLKELKKHNCCNIYSLGNGVVYNPLLIFKLIPYLKKYDIMHVHLFPALYWMSIAKLVSLSSVKIIYTEHSTTNRRRGLILFRFIDKLIYRNYNKIISIAEEVDFNLKEYLRFSESRFELIQNGVNIKFFEYAKPYSKNDFFSKEDIIIIQVASFREQKDQLTLIKALKILPDNIKLLLVGEGDNRKNCEKITRDLELVSRVKFLGIRMDVPRLLKTADIIVLSSHHEGLSLASIEAMASGKPLIASDVPGLREIVKDAGILFKKGDEKELAKHILSLVNDEHYKLGIVKKCLSRAEQFDIKKMVNGYSKLYKRIVNQS